MSQETDMVLSGTDLALGMKVNRSSPHVFNPKISLFTAVTKRTKNGTMVGKRSYEMGRNSHVPVDLRQLEADFGEALVRISDRAVGY